MCTKNFRQRYEFFLDFILSYLKFVLPLHSQLTEEHLCAPLLAIQNAQFRKDG